MTVRPVLRYPDPILKAGTTPVGTVGEPERRLARDLLDTMRTSPACVGLAAPQIGSSARAFVADVSGHRHATTVHGLIVMFDPVVERHDGADLAREGCMSVPHLTANVHRAGSILVSGLDLEGRRTTVAAEGFEARALLHEIDHLDGFLILDRAAAAGDVFPRKRYR